MLRNFWVFYWLLLETEKKRWNEREKEWESGGKREKGRVREEDRGVCENVKLNDCSSWNASIEEEWYQ